MTKNYQPGNTLHLVFDFKHAFKRLLFDLGTGHARLYTFLHRTFYKPKKGSLAELLDLFSRNSKTVRFLQVGANDGFFHDPLFKFIKMYGWQGVLLEPQPYVFDNYLKKLHANTPGVYPVNAALSDTDGKKNIYKISFSNARWATGLTSFNRQVLEEAIASGHVQRCANRYGDKLPASRLDFIEEQPVQSITPDTLMQQYQLQAIDWLQIDAEGYDFEIIKLMQISRTRPHVIAFEHSHLSHPDRRACTEHLAMNKYAICQIGENTVAMREPLGDLARFFGSGINFNAT